MTNVEDRELVRGILSRIDPSAAPFAHTPVHFPTDPDTTTPHLIAELLLQGMAQGPRVDLFRGLVLKLVEIGKDEEALKALYHLQRLWNRPEWGAQHIRGSVIDVYWDLARVRIVSQVHGTSRCTVVGIGVKKLLLAMISTGLSSADDMIRSETCAFLVQAYGSDKLDTSARVWSDGVARLCYRVQIPQHKPGYIVTPEERAILVAQLTYAIKDGSIPFEQLEAWFDTPCMPEAFQEVLAKRISIIGGLAHFQKLHRAAQIVGDVKLEPTAAHRAALECVPQSARQIELQCAGLRLAVDQTLCANGYLWAVEVSVAPRGTPDGKVHLDLEVVLLDSEEVELEVVLKTAAMRAYTWNKSEKIPYAIHVRAHNYEEHVPMLTSDAIEPAPDATFVALLDALRTAFVPRVFPHDVVEIAYRMESLDRMNIRLATYEAFLHDAVQIARDVLSAWDGAPDLLGRGGNIEVVGKEKNTVQTWGYTARKK